MKSTNLYDKFSEKYSVDATKVAEILKATAFKQKGDGAEITDAQLLALLVVADQYGLNPFTKQIYAFPDKQNGIVPVVGIDGWVSIINDHPQFDGLEFSESTEMSSLADAKECPIWMACTLFRKDRSHPAPIREYLDEVYRAPFKGFNKDTKKEFTVPGPWQSHTKRMLRHKSLIQAARIVFGFVGIYDQDEAERIIEGEVVTTPTSGTAMMPVKSSQAPTEKTVKKTQMLIERAKKDDSWQSALNFVDGIYTDADLDYSTRLINEAWQQHKQHSAGDNATVATSTGKQALAQAKEALN